MVCVLGGGVEVSVVDVAIIDVGDDNNNDGDDDDDDLNKDEEENWSSSLIVTLCNFLPSSPGCVKSSVEWRECKEEEEEEEEEKEGVEKVEVVVGEKGTSSVV